jgi:hypothetical protein
VVPVSVNAEISPSVGLATYKTPLATSYTIALGRLRLLIAVGVVDRDRAVPFVRDVEIAADGVIDDVRRAAAPAPLPTL